MKNIILAAIILISVSFLIGCGARVPGDPDSYTCKRYTELSETSPEKL